MGTHISKITPAIRDFLFASYSTCSDLTPLKQRSSCLLLSITYLWVSIFRFRSCSHSRELYSHTRVLLCFPSKHLSCLKIIVVLGRHLKNRFDILSMLNVSNSATPGKPQLVLHIMYRLKYSYLCHCFHLIQFFL